MINPILCVDPKERLTIGCVEPNFATFVGSSETIKTKKWVLTNEAKRMFMEEAALVNISDIHQSLVNNYPGEVKMTNLDILNLAKKLYAYNIKRNRHIYFFAYLETSMGEKLQTKSFQYKLDQILNGNQTEETKIDLVTKEVKDLLQ